MCGIVGSPNISMFEVMMEANVERGDFSTGVLQLKKRTGHETFKKEGLINFDQDLILDSSKRYYIGHVQAPTSGERGWGYETSHPFFTLDWAIVHNGVLTNDVKIRKNELPHCENPVDSSLIAEILQKNTPGKGTMNLEQQYGIICNALKMLEGTFALAIVYLPTNTIHIVRQGSILHIDQKGNFSTIKGKTFDLVPEGIVYRLNRSKWQEVGPFETKSPFVFV